MLWLNAHTSFFKLADQALITLIKNPKHVLLPLWATSFPMIMFLYFVISMSFLGIAIPVMLVSIFLSVSQILRYIGVLHAYNYLCHNEIKPTMLSILIMSWFESLWWLVLTPLYLLGNWGWMLFIVIYPLSMLIHPLYLINKVNAYKASMAQLKPALYITYIVILSISVIVVANLALLGTWLPSLDIFLGTHTSNLSLFFSTNQPLYMYFIILVVYMLFTAPWIHILHFKLYNHIKSLSNAHALNTKWHELQANHKPPSKTIALSFILFVLPCGLHAQSNYQQAPQKAQQILNQPEFNDERQNNLKQWYTENNYDFSSCVDEDIFTWTTNCSGKFDEPSMSCKPESSSKLQNTNSKPSASMVFTLTIMIGLIVLVLIVLRSRYKTSLSQSYHEIPETTAITMPATLLEKANQAILKQNLRHAFFLLFQYLIALYAQYQFITLKKYTTYGSLTRQLKKTFNASQYSRIREHYEKHWFGNDNITTTSLHTLQSLIENEVKQMEDTYHS